VHVVDETAHFMDETAHFLDENVTFQSYGSKGHFMDETAKLMEKKKYQPYLVNILLGLLQQLYEGSCCYFFVAYMETELG
jgi:hypothetical protein